MNVVSFPEQNVIFAKNQPEYRQLPAHLGSDGIVTCCWSLSWKERFRVLFTGHIWHQIKTFNMQLQPQLLSTEEPEWVP